MKYLYTTLVCLLMGFSAAGQGNLQFNRVFTWQVTTTSNNGGTGNLPGPTIPEGKIWKVEKACITYNSLSIYTGGTTQYSLVMNGLVLSERYQSSSGATQIEGQPAWFEAGTFPINYTIGIPSLPIRIALNVIEYNIIP